MDKAGQDSDHVLLNESSSQQSSGTRNNIAVMDTAPHGTVAVEGLSERAS